MDAVNAVLMRPWMRMIKHAIIGFTGDGVTDQVTENTSIMMEMVVQTSVGQTAAKLRPFIEMWVIGLNFARIISPSVMIITISCDDVYGRAHQDVCQRRQEKMKTKYPWLMCISHVFQFKGSSEYCLLLAWRVSSLYFGKNRERNNLSWRR